MERNAGENEQPKGPELASEQASASPRTHGADLTGVFKQVTVPDSQRKSASQPGGATDLFGTVPAQPAQSEQGFTQMFQSLGQKTEPIPQAPPLQKKEVPSENAAGEFTQLFRRLDEPQKKESYPLPAFSAPEKTAASSPEQLGGGFTQLLRTLSKESHEELPVERPRPIVQQTNEGPGEFTRIISRSALREAQQHPQPNPEPAPPLTPQPAQVAEPQTTPPVLPQNIFANAQSFANMAPAPTPAAAPLAAMPSTLPVPPAPAPVPAAPQTAGGKLQEYLPLLLIGNLFLMLTVLALVVFLLFHR